MTYNQWNLEGMKVAAMYLGEFKVEGTVELSRVYYGGTIKHTLVLSKEINVYGRVRDRVIVEHKYVLKVSD